MVQPAVEAEALRLHDMKDVTPKLGLRNKVHATSPLSNCSRYFRRGCALRRTTFGVLQPYPPTWVFASGSHDH
jgi:hypothetical protein